MANCHRVFVWAPRPCGHKILQPKHFSANTIVGIEENKHANTTLVSRYQRRNRRKKHATKQYFPDTLVKTEENEHATTICFPDTIVGIEERKHTQTLLFPDAIVGIEENPVPTLCRLCVDFVPTLCRLCADFLSVCVCRVCPRLSVSVVSVRYFKSFDRCGQAKGRIDQMPRHPIEPPSRR